MNVRKQKHQRGTRRLELADLRDALKDSRVWTAIGVVRDPGGGDAHYLIEDGDVLVEIEIMPGGEQALARLGSAAGGPGGGVWRIPPIGTEVAILVPLGEFDVSPIIIGTLSSNQPPTGLDADTIIVVAPKVVLGDPASQNSAANGVVVGQGRDPFTGQTYSTLGNSSEVVWAKK